MNKSIGDCGIQRLESMAGKRSWLSGGEVRLRVSQGNHPKMLMQFWAGRKMWGSDGGLN